MPDPAGDRTGDGRIGPLARRLPELLLLAAFLGYLGAWHGSMSAWPDTGTYQRVARDLSDGRLDELRLRTPGYPLLLIATGAVARPMHALFVTQLALYLGAVGLLVRLLRRLAVPPRAIVILTVLLVLPPSVEPTTYMLTESVSAFLLVCAFTALVGEGHDIRSGSLAGLAVACAALTRPTYLLLGVALTPVIWAWSSRRRAIALLVVSSAVIGGLSLSNYQRFGHFGINSGLGFNLSTRTVRVIELLPESPVKDVLIAARADELVHSPTHTGYMYIWGLQSKLSDVTGLDWIALERYMLALNLRLIRAAPGTYLVEVARAAGTYWTPYMGEVPMSARHPSYAVFPVVQLAVLALFWLTLAALAGAAVTHGLRSVRRPHLRAYGLAVVIILYTMLLSTTIDVGTPRYRVPTDPLIALSAILGTYMWSVERNSRPKLQSGAGC
jgi:hypothetical protein